MLPVRPTHGGRRIAASKRSATAFTGSGLLEAKIPPGRHLWGCDDGEAIVRGGEGRRSCADNWCRSNRTVLGETQGRPRRSLGRRFTLPFSLKYLEPFSVRATSCLTVRCLPKPLVSIQREPALLYGRVPRRATVSRGRKSRFTGQLTQQLAEGACREVLLPSRFEC